MLIKPHLCSSAHSSGGIIKDGGRGPRNRIRGNVCITLIIFACLRAVKFGKGCNLRLGQPMSRYLPSRRIKLRDAEIMIKILIILDEKFIDLEKSTILSSEDLSTVPIIPLTTEPRCICMFAVGRTVVGPIRKPHIPVNSSPLVVLLRTPFPRSPQILDAH
ncbi:hypothetical protein CEXT_747341 [Caerostris extrusa]|uniref:Uncharacterized protein n=1 Tax=Caerostris extrusa TaxID=172846 RepID=A0AAV4S066_CAEEX|nr:hypothetical protein CEXT_747341 [Caerostris extrusa]